MAYKITITNTTLRNYNLPYREKINERSTFLRDVNIPAGVLNYEIVFPSEEVYKAWKENHKSYLDGKNAVLVEGKTTGGKAEKKYEENKKEETKKTDAERKKITDGDEVINKELGINIETNVEKNSGEKK